MKLLIIFASLCVGFVQAVPPLQNEEPLRHYQIEAGAEGRIREAGTPADILPRYRLPSIFVPVSYSLRILPIMDENSQVGPRWTAPGSILIVANCTQDTNVITLHQYLLNINESSVTVRDIAANNFIAIQSQDYDEETHFYNITTSSPLRQELSYEIYIEFVALVSTNRTNGLYRASYTVPEDNEPRYMAGTQLESVHARQIFPSFDEPRWKAVFHIIIGRHSNYLSLSNAKIAWVEKHESLTNWWWDIYAPTEVMPTYLFSMAVADYAAAEENNLYRLPVFVYAARHLILQGAGDYSAKASANLMTFFESHLEAEYPFTKVDSILVPGKGGAMENWGLVTYGNFLMYYNGITSESERRGLNNIIAHELAHQWFGNIVTCEWWSDIWLNEGLASYFEFIGEEQFFNEFSPRKYILSASVQNALRFDAGPNSHPMVPDNIVTVPQIDAQFDTIAYDKGASIVRMMEGFLTEETLMKGLRKYLKRKRNDVALQDELFLDLQEAANEDGAIAGKFVKTIMDTWTLQKGFPLIQVSKAGSSRVYISQERFTNADAVRAGLDPNEFWEVPLSYATKDNPDFQDYVPKLWLEKDVILTSVSHDTSQWIIFNVDAMGYFRVIYDEPLTALIEQQLNTDFTVISPMSRSQLLDDYFASAFQSYVNIETALKLTKYLAAEEDYVVWFAVNANLRSAFNRFTGTDAFEPFKQYFEPRFAGALSLVGPHLPTDNGTIVLLRTQLLDWACALQNADCQDYATQLYSDWVDPSNNPYPPDYQSVLYCATVTKLGEEAFNFFLDKYESSSDAQRSRIVNALGCAEDEVLLNRLLSLSIDATSGLTLPHSTTARGRVAANSLGREIAFTFIKENLAEIIAYHSGDAGTISSFISTLSTYYASDLQLNEVENFISDNADDLVDVRTSLDNSVNVIKSNIAWMSKFYTPMKEWFETETSLQ